jgi:IS1 family transposase/transposase-like protein
MNEKITRRPLESLACVNEGCELYGQPGKSNLRIRKVYGKDELRYLRCGRCGREFSERKNTALWNTKVRESKAIAVAEQLAEGTSIKGTTRVTKVDTSVVRRLSRCLREQGQQFHDERVQDVEVEALQADERHGYAINKRHPSWEAELMDPKSKFILSHVQGRRGEQMTRALFADGVKRLRCPQNLVLFTDGEPSYASLFPEFFGQAYRPARQGNRGRRPNIRYRIPRTLAHVQIIKHRAKGRLTHLDIRYTHGSVRRIKQALAHLGYNVPNTSAIERRNGTARRMSAYQVRRSLAFAHLPDTKVALGWWAVTVSNWCRLHRSLRLRLPVPQGKKSSYSVRLPWLLALPNISFRFPIFSSPLFILQGTEIISLNYQEIRDTS